MHVLLFNFLLALKCTIWKANENLSLICVPKTFQSISNLAISHSIKMITTFNKNFTNKEWIFIDFKVSQCYGLQSWEWAYRICNWFMVNPWITVWVLHPPWAAYLRYEEQKDTSLHAPSLFTLVAFDIFHYHQLLPSALRHSSLAPADCGVKPPQTVSLILGVGILFHQWQKSNQDTLFESVILKLVGSGSGKHIGYLLLPGSE